VERLTPPKSTPLRSLHESKNAHMVPFAGWGMPLYYPGGILEEHRLVRGAAGLFDVSHMGRLRIEGPDALPFTNRVIANDAGRLAPDQLLYACVCNEVGGVLDDVTVYRIDPGFLMVVNAANRERIGEWLASHATSGVTIRDETEATAQVALQGPASSRVIAPILGADVAEDLGYYRHRTVTWDGEKVLVSRNGYTGEDGFEMYIGASRAADFAERILDAGRDDGVRPVGLGARDTLRMEMAFCLYGHELDPETTPLEAGLGWTVKMSKEDFIGKDALAAQKVSGIPRTLVGFVLEGRTLPRRGDEILAGGRPAGQVTSGGISPSLGIPVGLGFLDPRAASADPGTPLEIRSGRGRWPARIASRPFYRDGSARTPGRKPPRAGAPKEDG
jgi:aminomethyltransferase